MRASVLQVVACALLGAACSSSSSAGVDAMVQAAPANQCTAYGEGYVCQAGPTCSAGYVDKEDYFCGVTDQLCCGPVGEGGVDASDDVNVFVDGAVFETGARDAAHDATVHADAGVDAGTRDAGDAGHARDAARDVIVHHDADEHVDAVGKHDGAAKRDAKHD